MAIHPLTRHITRHLLSALLANCQRLASRAGGIITVGFAIYSVPLSGSRPLGELFGAQIVT